MAMSDRARLELFSINSLIIQHTFKSSIQPKRHHTQFFSYDIIDTKWPIRMAHKLCEHVSWHSAHQDIYKYAASVRVCECVYER